MVDPLLQERIDDFKKDLIEVCKRHRMGIIPDGCYSDNPERSLVIVDELLTKNIEVARSTDG